MVDIIHIIYFAFQSAFMNNVNYEQQQDLQHIKQMMERSSRFISLSGLSGVSAGVCALIGSYFAGKVILQSHGKEVTQLDSNIYEYTSHNGTITLIDFMGNRLFFIAIVTFIAAFSLSFLFTYLRSKKTNTPLWGTTSRRLAFSVCLPMLVGGIYLYKLIQCGVYGLIAPGCLFFYGLALVNASKYTLGEVKYLGYMQLVLGVINLWFIGYGLYFWAIGFGMLHIIYGVYMWNKYERA